MIGHFHRRLTEHVRLATESRARQNWRSHQPGQSAAPPGRRGLVRRHPLLIKLLLWSTSITGRSCARKPDNWCAYQDDENRVDSLAQSCGLSLPTFNKRGWNMTAHIHSASTIAGVASTPPFTPCLKRVGFTPGNCGLSPPALFERIGIAAAESQQLAARVLTAHQRLARVPVTDAPTRSRQDGYNGLAAGYGWRSGKGFTVGTEKTSTAIVSGLLLRRRGMHARAGPFARSVPRHR